MNDDQERLTAFSERLADAMLNPVKEVGTLLARELDAAKTEIKELQQHVRRLEQRVAGLEEHVGP